MYHQSPGESLYSILLHSLDNICRREGERESKRVSETKQGRLTHLFPCVVSGDANKWKEIKGKAIKGKAGESVVGLVRISLLLNFGIHHPS